MPPMIEESTLAKIKLPADSKAYGELAFREKAIRHLRKARMSLPSCHGPEPFNGLSSPRY